MNKEPYSTNAHKEISTIKAKCAINRLPLVLI